MASLLKMLFTSNKSIYLLLLLIPIQSLCGLCSPIAVKGLTGFLTPGSFYDCDQMFTSDPKFVITNYTPGLRLAFANLWGYLLLTLISQFLNPIAQNLSFSLCVRLATKGINSLLDLVYFKLLSVSD